MILSAKVLKKSLILSILSVMYSSSYCQVTKTWSATSDGNWNSDSNWSPSGVPSTDDLVVFDNTSDFNCTIDIAIEIESFTITSDYDGVISQGAGNTIQVNNGMSLLGGTFTGSEAAINVFEDFILDGTSFTSTSGRLSFFEGADGTSNSISFNSGAFNHNNGTAYFDFTSNNNDIIGSFNFYDLTFLGRFRSLDINDNINVSNDLVIDNTNGSIIINLQQTLTVQGDITYQGGSSNITVNDGGSDTGTIRFEGSNINLNSTNTGGGGSALLHIVGTGTQSINAPITSGQSPLPNIRIECNILNLSGHITLLSRDWEYLSGTLNHPSQFELILNGSCSLLGNAHTLDDLTVIGSFTVTNFIAPITIEGDFSIQPTFRTILSFQAPITLNNDLNLATSAIDDGNNRDIVLNISTNSKLTVLGDLITSGSHDVTINNDTLRVNGNIFIAHSGDGGGGSAVLELGGTNQTIDIDETLSDDEGLFPSLYINLSGTLNFATSETFNLTGTWNYNQGTLDLSSTTISVNVSNNISNRARIMGNAHTLNNLSFRGGRGYLDIEAPVTIDGDLSIESTSTDGPTVLTLTDELSVAGNYNTSGPGNVSIEGDIMSVQGNLNIKHLGTGGATGGGSGVVNINGSGNQLLSGGTQYLEGHLPDVIVEKSNGLLTLEGFISVSGDWTLNDGTIDSRTNGSTLTMVNSGFTSTGLDLTSPDGNMMLDNLIVDVNRTGSLQINANLDLSGNLSILDNRSLQSNNHDVTIGGDWTNNNTTDDGFNEGTGTVTFNGNTRQTISCPSCTNGEVYYNVIFNNNGDDSEQRDIFLNTSIQVTNNVTLTDGIVETNTGAQLQMTSNSSTNIGSIDSYVNGEIAYEKATSGISTLNFPLGKDEYYRPISIEINHSTTTSYTYTASLTNASATALGYGLGPNLGNVSSVRYWDVNRAITGGADDSSPDIVGNPSITLFYDTDDEVADFENLVVGKYDGTTNWENIGGNATGNGSGSVTSTSNPVAFTSFSGQFTLANNGDGINPLPVELIQFTIEIENGKPKLFWSTSTEINNDYFMIERKGGVDGFKELGKVSGSGNSSIIQDYEFTDETARLNSTYVYRLSQVDFDGSKEILGINRIQTSNYENLKIAHSIERNEFAIRNLLENEQILEIVIYNLNGKRLKAEQNDLWYKLPQEAGGILIHIVTNLRRKTFKLFP